MEGTDLLNFKHLLLLKNKNKNIFLLDTSFLVWNFELGIWHVIMIMVTLLRKESDQKFR